MSVLVLRILLLCLEIQKLGVLMNFRRVKYHIFLDSLSLTCWVSLTLKFDLNFNKSLLEAYFLHYSPVV